MLIKKHSYVYAIIENKDNIKENIIKLQTLQDFNDYI